VSRSLQASEVSQPGFARLLPLAVGRATATTTYGISSTSRHAEISSAAAFHSAASRSRQMVGCSRLRIAESPPRRITPMRRRCRVQLFGWVTSSRASIIDFKS
jgi:hypothetical protein